ncbi:FAD-dependent monooxygenase [Nisaea sediminum]|uniref:FAD-dependent monooxygenase n=1 Tax=Nisaea sediminum TaxID=2775867 RepID=UPI001866FF5D|nr:FAD-dependent monooxygenase [Nisaea sediminum]
MSADGTALIIGSGVGGLSAAIALSRIGVACEIFERGTEIGRGGTGLTLWPNALRALEKLGITRNVTRHADPLQRGEIFTSKGLPLTSVDLSEISRRSGMPLICLRRSDLYGALLDALPDVPIHTGKRCVSWREHADGITAQFEDGSTATGDFLVAADGIRSRLRHIMLGEDPLRYVGWMTWRGVADLPPGTFPSGLYREFFGRGSRFGIFAIRADRVYWYGTLSTEADERAPVDPSHRPEALAHFRDWPEPAATVIASTEDANLVRTGVYDTEPLPRWAKGRMAVLGDAAHPMTPDLGQGACQAIEDALALADSVVEGGAVPDILQRYEARGLARTQGLVARSRRVGKMRQWRHPLLTALRAATMRAIPPKLLLKMFETD